MTPEEADRGLVELVLPEGGRVQVEFRGEMAPNPDVEASVERIMLDAESTGGDVCDAILKYAETSGLSASLYLGRDSMIVAIGVPVQAIEKLEGIGMERSTLRTARGRPLYLSRRTVAR